MKRAVSVAVALALLAPCLCVTVASSQEGRTIVIRGNGEKMIPVWRSEYDAKAGSTLADSGHRDLALKYLACAVQPGTRALIMPGGYSTFRIAVLDGSARGCEGNVFSYDVNGDKAERARKWKEYRDKSERESKKALEDAQKAADDSQKRLEEVRGRRGTGSQGWPEWKKYLECTEKRTDPAEDCTRHLQ